MPREQEHDILQKNTAGRNHGRRWRIACVVDSATAEDTTDATRTILTVWEETFDKPVTSPIVTRLFYSKLQEWLTEHLRLGGTLHTEVAYVLQAEDFFGRWATTHRLDHLMKVVIKEHMAAHRLTETS
jgi:hypothetical protein